MEAHLSKREIEVSQWLAYGFSDKEIAAKLFVSFDTIRTHHKNIYAKIGARNLADLTRWFFKIETRQWLAIALLVLVVGMEFYHIPALRNRTIRAPRAAFRSSVARNNSKTFEL